MADAKISQLPSGVAADSDEVPVNQAGTTRKLTVIGVADRKTWANLAGVPAAVSGTTASFTTAQETKLAGIETGAQVERENIVRLGSDVVNSTTLLADVTGLSFPMLADTEYLVEMFLRWTSAAAATGIQWAVNGPASPTIPFLGQVLTLGQINGQAQGYDSGPIILNGDTSAGFSTFLFGHVGNGANAGDLIARFRSEVGGSAVTVKAGSILRYRIIP